MKAYGELSQTRHVESVTKFLSPSFTAVSDGVRGDYQSAQNGWQRYLDRLNRGEQITHSVELENVQAQTKGNFAWVIYNYTFKESSGSKVLISQKGICTQILSRSNNAWLIEHEHCSSSPTGR
jgi:hypothetical protein